MTLIPLTDIRKVVLMKRNVISMKLKNKVSVKLKKLQ